MSSQAEERVKHTKYGDLNLTKNLIHYLDISSQTDVGHIPGNSHSCTGRRHVIYISDCSHHLLVDMSCLSLSLKNDIG